MKNDRNSSSETTSEQPLSTPRSQQLPARNRPSSGSVSSTPHAIELHVEELVLDGFAPGDRDRISASFDSELARIFGERGVPPSFARHHEIDAITDLRFDVREGASPETIGAQLAHVISERFTR